MKIEERRDDYNNRWWYMGSNFHREDGPAIIYSDKKERWVLNNRFYYHLNEMPLNLFLAYVKWEYKKLNGN